MKDRNLQIRNVAFYVMLPVFVLSNVSLESMFDLLFIPLGLPGLAVVLLTIRLKEGWIQKLFFFLAGGAGAGLFITCAVFSLLRWSGHTPGGDGGGITVPMLLLCPVVFMIGAVGAIVCLIKGKIAQKKIAS